MSAARGDRLAWHDRLSFRHVGVYDGDVEPVLVQRFEDVVASLGADEWIEIEFCISEESVGTKLMTKLLSAPSVDRICSVIWDYPGCGEAEAIVLQLIDRCPGLLALNVRFREGSALDFSSEMLENPRCKIEALTVSRCAVGDETRFFRALSLSRVTSLIVLDTHSAEFYRGLCDYVAKGSLAVLEVWQVAEDVLSTLISHCRVVELVLVQTIIAPRALAHFPTAITKLTFSNCVLVDDFDWSFLTDCNLREMNVLIVKCKDAVGFGDALAIHLNAKGMEALRVFRSSIVAAALATVGPAINQIKMLDVGNASSAIIEATANALKVPGCAMRVLKMTYGPDTEDWIVGCLLPASKQANCSLDKLVLWAHMPGDKFAAAKIEAMFGLRGRLFALLVGHHLRRRSCALRRLPVEMFRMVGDFLK